MSPGPGPLETGSYGEGTSVTLLELEANLREDFTITEKAATNSPLLKVPTSTFTLKNLLRPYAKQL